MTATGSILFILEISLHNISAPLNFFLVMPCKQLAKAEFYFVIFTQFILMMTVEFRKNDCGLKVSPV